MASGKEIKRLRDKDDKSAAKAAELIGVDAERLRKWEQRDADPSDSGDIERIESYFGTTLDKLPELDNFQFIKRAERGHLDKSKGRLSETDGLKDKVITLSEKLIEEKEDKAEAYRRDVLDSREALMDVQLKILATIETLVEDRAREAEEKTGKALSEIEKEFRARVKARQEKMKKGISEQRFS